MNIKHSQDMMTKNPVCCVAEDKVYEIAQRMQYEDIGAMPVVSDHESRRLVGIITDRDLALRVVGASRDVTQTSVGEVMTINPVTCTPLDTLDVALLTMAEHQIRRIPIVNEQGAVVGIIAQADIALRLNDSDMLEEVVGQISEPEPKLA